MFSLTSDANRRTWKDSGLRTLLASPLFLIFVLCRARSGLAFPGQVGVAFPTGAFSTVTSPGPSPPSSAPAKGKFLVASRRLGDPNFAETVILLIEYNDKGAMGVVINRQVDERLSTLLPNVKGLQHRSDSIFLGGPVGTNQMLILARSPKDPEESSRVFEDVYTIAGQTALEKLIHDAGAKAKFRAYVGYSGWGAGQLDFEIAQGGWHIVPADTAAIFDKPPSEIWPDLIRRGEGQWVLRQTPDLSLLLSLNPLGSLPLP